jgi:hypothetical protein
MTNQIEGAIQRWMDNPDGGGSFLRQRDAIAKHDQECESLKWAWLPRKTGSVCPSDLSYCDAECGITFFNEGVFGQVGDCKECWFCECCAKNITVCPCEEELMMRAILGGS